MSICVREASEWQRVLICSLYFRLAGGGEAFEAVEALLITEPEGHDPMYIVQARKPGAGSQEPEGRQSPSDTDNEDGVPSMV